MAKTFLTSIDLAGNELMNASIHNLATAPASPKVGQIYFNTGTKIPMFWNGTAWTMFGHTTSEINDIVRATTLTGYTKGANSALAASDSVLGAFGKIQGQIDGKQPLDADLTAIATLTGTSGFLKKTSANNWTLDTNTYLLSSATAVAASKLANSQNFSITGGATAAAISFDGTGPVALEVTSLDASKLATTTTIPSGVLGRSTLYVGTTAVKLNRPSGALALTGITSIAIGSAVLKYDAANNAVYVEKSDGTAANFYSTGGVSAFGLGDIDSGGGGETALSLLTDVSLATPVSGNVLIYNGTHWENKPQSEIVPNLSPYALKTYVDSKVASIVDSAPETLDTLVELAEALGNDPDFATTVATNIGTKVTKNADITAGTGTKITYDAKGLVTGSASLTNTDIPSGITASKIAQTATYRMVSDTQIGNWNTAHGWGNHADAGYIKSFTNTTYTAKTDGGLKLVGTVFEADFGTGANQVARGNHSHNFGVLTVATGTANGTISVNTNGTTANVAVKGLGTAAYTASSAYAQASHNHSASNITSGTLAVARGGTGLTDAKEGFARKVTGAIAAALTTVVTHGLSSADIIASVMTTAGEVVECDIINTATTTTFRFNVAPAANTYKYVIIG